ncbi:MAG: carboxymuconolactone decarboxylase family protein [Candidatus Ranarchaeia archaeon]
MSGNPHDVIRKFDPEAVDDYMKTQENCFSDGALSKKTKILIALALDAIKASQGGVRTLASKALEEGATWDEIKEALRVAYYVGSATPYWTAIHGLEDLVKEK